MKFIFVSDVLVYVLSGWLPYVFVYGIVCWLFYFFQFFLYCVFFYIFALHLYMSISRLFLYCNFAGGLFVFFLYVGRIILPLDTVTVVAKWKMLLALKAKLA